MRAPSAEVICCGRERVRAGSWRGDTQVAYLAPLPDAPLPSAQFLSKCLVTLSEQGFEQVITAALSPSEQAGFLEAGFQVHERLHLLGLDLDRTLPPLPPGPRTYRGRQADHRAVLRIDETAFSEFWRFDEAGLLGALAATPSTRFRVMRHDSGVCGYAICGRAGRRGFVQRLAVSSAQRQQGMGMHLLLDGLHWMRRHGVQRAVVNTQLGNDAALRLYDRAGFREEPAGLSVLVTGLP